MLTSQTITEDMSIWEIALQYQTILNETMRVMLQRAVDYDSVMLFDSSEIEKIREKKTFTYDLATSNLGVTPLQKKYGELIVEQFYFLTNQRGGFSGIFLNMATVGETLFGNFTYAYPLRHHETIQKLRSLYFDILKKYIPNFALLPSP